MSDRELDITISAYLKSIIESGKPKEEWEPLLLHALRTHKQIKNAIINARNS